jgi:hypothetical protein
MPLSLRMYLGRNNNYLNYFIQLSNCMKYVDIILIGIVALLLIVAAKFLFSIISLKIILKILFGILIMGLFLYKQLKPHRNALSAENRKKFGYVERFFDWLFKVFPVKLMKLGNSLSIDYTSLIVLSILIILLII